MEISAFKQKLILKNAMIKKDSHENKAVTV